MTATAPALPSSLPGTVRVRPAVPAERERIYGLRHEAYATELGQHPENPEQRLTDRLDDINDYLVAVDGDQVWGLRPGRPTCRAVVT